MDWAKDGGSKLSTEPEAFRFNYLSNKSHPRGGVIDKSASFDPHGNQPWSFGSSRGARLRMCYEKFASGISNRQLSPTPLPHYSGM